MTQQKQTMLNAGTLLFALLWLALIGITLDPAVDDFERYWQAATDFLRYGNPYVTRPDYFYPPFFVYLILPFGWLTHQQGQWIWFGLNIMALSAFIALCIRASGSQLARRYWGIVTLAMVLAPPTRLSLQLGQVSIMLALVLLASILLAQRHAWLSGLLLAGASLVRINPAFLGLYYLWRKPRSVAWWSIASGVLLLLLSLIIFSPAPYQHYISNIVQSNVARQGAYPYAAEHNISLFGFWSRLLTTNPHAIPVIDAPILAFVLVLATSLIGLWVCLAVGRSNPDNPLWLLHVSVWLCGMMLLWPTNGYYNLVILLLPILIVVRLLEEHMSRQVRIWLIVTTALLCIPPGWSNFHPMLYTTLHTKWGLLLLSPACYGLCMAMGFLAILAKRKGATLQATSSQ